MDLNAAIRILQERQTQPPNTLSDRPSPDSVPPIAGQVIELGEANDDAGREIDLAELYGERLDLIADNPVSELSEMELLNIFLQLQTVRVRTYASYNRALHTLITTDRLQDYQHVCRDMTQRLNAINAAFRRLQEEFTARNRVRWGNLVNDLQSQEREKLTLVAALHMDECRENFLTKHEQYDALEALLVGKASAMRRVVALESKVTDILEEIQIEKQDLLDAS